MLVPPNPLTHGTFLMPMKSFRLVRSGYCNIVCLFMASYSSRLTRNSFFQKHIFGYLIVTLFDKDLSNQNGSTDSWNANTASIRTMLITTNQNNNYYQPANLQVHVSNYSINSRFLGFHL